ncbi:hypothetical protein [Nonomuraea fuscirosea]|uniref:hypothetical protein n=1 Tax=Nonomuraea fuscirosea TaxID=1291556 RepID=UPI0033F6FE32
MREIGSGGCVRDEGVLVFAVASGLMGMVMLVVVDGRPVVGIISRVGIMAAAS